MPWYSVFSFFIFLFRSNGKKEHLDENDFCHGYGNYFKSAALKVTWFQLCSKLFVSNYEVYWQRHLKDTLQWKILWRWINIHANSFLGKYHEMKMGERASEVISCTKSLPVPWRTLHQGISLIIVLFFASQTNIVFKFSLVLIDWYLPQFVYLYLWILSVSWSWSSASMLFYKNQ